MSILALTTKIQNESGLQIDRGKPLRTRWKDKHIIQEISLKDKNKLWYEIEKPCVYGVFIFIHFAARPSSTAIMIHKIFHLIHEHSPLNSFPRTSQHCCSDKNILIWLYQRSEISAKPWKPMNAITRFYT